ncbi:hypothetical protein GEV43_26170 [Actinomadura sp. J1-007]|uniref:SseB family protein n=1 Tax=Actinomadura sp. J1-007 TaxID=2661913 RepID=UPI0013291787|nr:SseB family protein [Actinomadura sp. J1-007]MWK37208.1 hypothetical protein [Actinomadura sp. J1-007]
MKQGVATVADAWRPTSDFERRLQDTVRSGDQEGYFRLLADGELVVPVPPDLIDDVLANEAQPTWPTQDEDGRTHVLVYTSAEAMRACLGPAYRHFMKLRFADLAQTWPDARWWLAVDVPAQGVTGVALPIESRLPSWFVRQVAEGDGRPPVAGRPDLIANAPQAVPPAQPATRPPETARDVPLPHPSDPTPPGAPFTGPATGRAHTGEPAPGTEPTRAQPLPTAPAPPPSGAHTAEPPPGTEPTRAQPVHGAEAPHPAVPPQAPTGGPHRTPPTPHAPRASPPFQTRPPPHRASPTQRTRKAPYPRRASRPPTRHTRRAARRRLAQTRRTRRVARRHRPPTRRTRRAARLHLVPIPRGGWATWRQRGRQAFPTRRVRRTLRPPGRLTPPTRRRRRESCLRPAGRTFPTRRVRRASRLRPAERARGKTRRFRTTPPPRRVFRAPPLRLMTSRPPFPIRHARKGRTLRRPEGASRARRSPPYPERTLPVRPAPEIRRVRRVSRPCPTPT